MYEKKGASRVRVLVTGGAGFIGRHLVTALLTSGHDVLILDNFRRATRDASPAGATILEGDIRDREVVRSSMANCQRVYHLAAQSSVMGAVIDMEYSFTSNVVGTYHILSCAVERGIGRVVFTSSREVYGEVEQLPVAEDRPTAPKNAYGASKVASEAYCRVFQATYGLEVNVLRLANVYGPGDRDRVIPIWLDRAAHSVPLELYGGQQVLDFVPVDLVVEALLHAGETSLDSMPINIGTGVGTPLKDLAARIQRLPGAHVDVRTLPPRSIEVTRFVADVTRMQGVLGLEPPEDPLLHLPALWDNMRALIRPRGIEL
jgi:UDP-glucose 4-epimerase